MLKWDCLIVFNCNNNFKMILNHSLVIQYICICNKANPEESVKQYKSLPHKSTQLLLFSIYAIPPQLISYIMVLYMYMYIKVAVDIILKKYIINFFINLYWHWPLIKKTTQSYFWVYWIWILCMLCIMFCKFNNKIKLNHNLKTFLT